MISSKAKPLLLLFLGAALFAALAAALVFGGVMRPHYQRTYSLSDFGPPQFDYHFVNYGDLPGWLQDDLTLALSAFLLSCDIFDEKNGQAPANPFENLGAGVGRGGLSGLVADWREPCKAARAINGQNHADPSAWRSAVRSYFEFYFQPALIRQRREPLPDGPARRSASVVEMDALFTGYFEPAYAASRNPTSMRSSPIYPRPDDLVEVDLGAFREDLSDERIAGRVEEGRLVPYPDRKAINNGALAGIVEPLAWLAPDDLFFLQIQGSGRLFLGADDIMRVGYAAQNGHPYTAIGRVMVERGLMPLEEISMQSIRSWLEKADTAAAQALREENASYVFFRDLGRPPPGLGPPGAQDVPLTPGRSLAVDRRFHALGALVWVDIEPLAEAGPDRLQRLMVAQDIGGAIKGPLRGDVFWGAGDRAGEIAGKMNARGRFYVLTPKSVAARLSGEGAR